MLFSPVREFPSSIFAAPRADHAVSAGRRARALARLSEELRPALAGCESKVGRGLTRGELALVFEVCPRTVARWEDAFDLPVVRRNARVLIHEVESVVLLCAQGFSLDRRSASEVGLLPDAVLALASKHGAIIGRRKNFDNLPINPVLIATTDDERRLIRLWNDPIKRAGIVTLIRAMSI